MDTVDIKGHELYLLERILNRQQSDIKNHFTKSDVTELAYRYMFPADLIPNLENKGLLYYSGDYAYITDFAKRCLEDKYRKERDLINENILDNYEYAFLEFMNNRNEPVPMFHFPVEFINHSEIHGKAVEGSPGSYLDWFGEVNKYVEAPNVYGYVLNSLGKSRFNKLSKENKTKEEKGNLEMQKLRGDVDNIANTLTDYPNVQSRSIWALRVAIIVAVIELLKWIVELSKHSVDK